MEQTKTTNNKTNDQLYSYYNEVLLKLLRENIDKDVYYSIEDSYYNTTSSELSLILSYELNIYFDHNQKVDLSFINVIQQEQYSFIVHTDNIDTSYNENNKTLKMTLKIELLYDLINDQIIIWN